MTDVSSFGVSVSIESFPQGEPARNWLGKYVLTSPQMKCQVLVPQPNSKIMFGKEILLQC